MGCEKMPGEALAVWCLREVSGRELRGVGCEVSGRDLRGVDCELRDFEVWVARFREGLRNVIPEGSGCEE